MHRMIAASAAASALALSLWAAPVATAQSAADFPAKPVTLVVPTAPSVSGDLLMRAFAEAASKHLGQPLVVENKPGGSGALAGAYVATQKRVGGYRYWFHRQMDYRTLVKA